MSEDELGYVEASLALRDAERHREKQKLAFSRNLTYVSVAATLLLASIGMWALQQRNTAIDQRRKAELATEEAMAQRNRAEGAFNEAIDASNTLVSSMVQKLRDVTGMKISLAQAILEPALKLQDRLISSGETSLDLRRSQAVALVEAARTQLAIGDTDSAFSSATKSRDIMLDLVPKRPENTQWHSDLSNAYALIGVVQEAEGLLLEGVKSYADSFAIVQQMALSEPNNSIACRSPTIR